MLSLPPPVSEIPAAEPMAMLLLPVLLRSALNPLAVLKLPTVLLRSALNPLAVLLLPVVLLMSATAPLAVLLVPVLLKSALSPIAVLLDPMATFSREIFGAVPPLKNKGTVALTALTPTSSTSQATFPLAL